VSGTQQQQEPPLIAFEVFTGLNTNASRVGIEDTELSWCDGFMPVGNSKLRTLPDIGPSVWAAPSAGQVAFFDFGNIGATPYMIVPTTDGAIWQVNTTTTSPRRIAPPGTIAAPTRNTVGLTQWGSQFIIIVANQPDGYFILDGQNFYQAGTLAPATAAALTSGGANYNSNPVLHIYGGSGSGAAATATITEGSISAIQITNPGSGYSPGDIVQIGFSGGGADTAARLRTVLVGTSVQSVTLISGGFGYTNGTGYSMTFSGAGGSGAAGTFDVSGGTITNVNVSGGGSAYNAAPTVSFTGAGSGSGAAAVAIMSPVAVASVVVDDPGTGFQGTPTLTIEGGGGSGAAATVTALSGGSISTIHLSSGGNGYTSAPAVVVQPGLNSAATAILDVMPFGVQGTSIETYQSRIWITKTGSVLFSAPGSYTDFSISGGGGAFASNDSYLRVGYTQVRQTNGFLYLIADSSISYISNVQTGGSPVSTTFTNQNANPEVGTPYAGAIDTLGSNIIFANDFGVHVSYGGTVTKVSIPLDGVYNTVPGFGGFQPSSAKAIVYGKRLWMVLLPIIDPTNGIQFNKMFMWDEKRWWSTSQGVGLIYIQSQEISSVLTAWGTDGTHVYRLFQTPSGNFTKKAQSKLFARPGGYMVGKSANRVWMIAQYASRNIPDIVFNVDNETGSSPVTLLPSGAFDTGFWISPPTAIGQVGSLLGMTLTTNASDVTIVSAAIDAISVQYRG
jgi:hypothetical protein